MLTLKPGGLYKVKKNIHSGIVVVDGMDVLRQIRMIHLEAGAILTFLFHGKNKFHNHGFPSEIIPVFIYENNLIWLTFENNILDHIVLFHA